MTPTIAPGHVYQGLGYYRSTGYGTTAQRLSQFLFSEAAVLFKASVSLTAKFETIRDLSEMYKSWLTPNWDGEGATAISEAAYLEAARFIRLLPVACPMPEITPEPNGQIGLEWYVGPDRMFVAALGGRQLITFAGLFGRDVAVHGTEHLSDSLPESILTNLQRLFST